jgi:tetratricopeptide (TPR) repeat protein
LGGTFRFLCMLVLIVMASVGAVAALTGLGPKQLLALWLAGGAPARAGPAPARRPAAQEIPLYSDVWIDDSGISLAVECEQTPTDPASLAQVAAARKGRGARGIARFTESLAQLGLPRTDREAMQAQQYQLRIGLLHMFEGRFEEASSFFQAARKTFPSKNAEYDANLEALLGVAALRRGESDNCIACCTDASCIFPLARSAVHQQQAGSRQAIEHFTAYLEKRPEDIGVRWLLNIAYMTLGEYPEKVPARYLIRLEPFRSRIDVGRFPNVAARVGLDALGENNAGGCIVDDFTGDGRLDVFTSNLDPERGPGLFINRGDGMFEERAESAGLADQVGAANATHADYDNDGDLDLLLLRGGWERAHRPSLLRNRGDGTFEDVTVAAGLHAPIASQSGAWADYDNDGFVDLYLVGEFNSRRPDLRNYGRLYHNNGNGTFTDVAASAGVLNRLWGKGAAWGDYDDDGDPDLYVSNDTAPNRLYRNNGDGTFTDVAPALGVTEPLGSFACWWWDYNNDGRLDLFVCNFGNRLSDVIRSHLGQPTPGERPRLFRNEGPGGFRDVTIEAGLDRVLVCMGSNFGDLDNDGYLDMYLGTGRAEYRYVVPNLLLKNVDGLRFEDVTTSSGTGHLQKGHGIAFADWDRDGDLDIFLEAGGATPGDRAHNALFLNPGHGNHWLTVRLVGTKTNRAAIGAGVRVDLPKPGGGVESRHRIITCGSSYGGNPFPLTIGLGQARSVVALEVSWPTSRTRQVFHDVPVDRAIEITEGRDTFRVLEARPIPLPGAARTSSGSVPEAGSGRAGGVSPLSSRIRTGG